MHILSGRPREVNPNERATANLLGALATALTDEMEQLATAELGRSPSSVATLLSIGTRPGSYIAELGRIVGTSHSATVRIVDALEAEGLVRRRTSADDARRVDLFLTASGTERFESLREARVAALDRHVETLDPSDRQTLHRLLHELLESVADDGVEARHVCRFCDHAICRGRDCPVGRAFA